MKRLLIGALSFMITIPTFASISKQQTQQIFNQLTRANNIQAQLGFVSSEEINAYGGRGQVVVTEGMLRYADRNVMIYVLAHELGHATGHVSELEADRVSGRIGTNAGMNVCPGAKKFLLGVGLEGEDGIHPDGDVRLKAMCQ